MCISCKKIWTALHVLGSVIYVSTGAVQIVIGIFFVISIPIFSLSSNIWAGSWNVLVGICGGMFACFGKQTAGRQEMLLYLIVAVIIVNTVNAAICEWHFLMANVGDAFVDITTALLLGKNSTSELLLPDEKNNFINNSNNIYYVVLTTRICAAVVIITAFVDSQFTYCSIQSQNRSQTAKAKKNKGSHEQVSDIEYIIPRPKKNTAPKSNKNIYNAYAQSWVFDADATVSTNNSENSPYLKLDDVIDNNDSTTLSVPTPTKQSLKYDIITRNGSITSSALAFEDTDNILKTPVVHIEEASDDSNSNNTNVGGGVRKLSAMKSFSRTPSPNVLSASSSQVSLVVVTPQIYECLERLTEPSVYRSRLSTAISERDIQQRCISPVSCKSPGHPDSRSPIGGEKVQYASLMQELQQQFMNKKDKLKHQTSSPPSGEHSVTVSDKSSRQEESSSRTTTDPKSNSDAEFSKELEAALQLIQDLESPNTTIETPSEEPPPYRIQKTSNVWHQRGALNVDNNCTITDDNTSESDEKTLSAIGSLAELTSPMTECFPSDVLHTFKPQLHGKSTSVISILNTDSQSTSGYSSPTFHNFNGSNNIINNNTHQLSNSSSINGSTNDLGNKLACSILNTKTATIISLRRPINNLINNDHSKRKSITLVNINSNDEMIVNECCIRSKIPPKPPIRQDSIPNNIATITDKPNISYVEKAQTIDRISRINNNNNNHDLMKNSCGSLNRLGNLGINHNNSSTSLWNVKSLLRKKKIHVPPLPPELEGAIIKSESLAYLSDDELLARHERNRQIQRHIEQRVHQQLTGQIPSESHC